MPSIRWSRKRSWRRAIDSTHPEFSGAITESFDAMDGGKEKKDVHGNEVAGMVHGTRLLES
jgi:hypothetical protein